MRNLFLAMAAMLVWASSATADAVVSYGVNEGGVFFIDLLANTGNQARSFFVSGGDNVDGLELNLQIGDGGVFIGGTDSGPRMGAINLITGTIFAPASPNQQDIVNSPLAKKSTVDTASLVVANGLIGQVIFDTTGFGPGLYGFRLTGVAGNNNTKFFNGQNTVNTTAPNGFLRITAIPEPSTMLVVLGSTAICLLRRRKN